MPNNHSENRSRSILLRLRFLHSFDTFPCYNRLIFAEGGNTMRKLTAIILGFVLCLTLCVPAAAADSRQDSNSGLSGRSFLVLGDSYTAGYGLVSMEQDWTYLMTNAFGMTQQNYSISGSTFAAGPRGNYPMVERCLSLPEDDTLDFVLLQGGSNDWAKNIPLGDVADRQPDTFCGALNLILDSLLEKYPDAVLVGFSPWISDDTKNSVGCTAQDYTDAMLYICDQRDILCYDASNAEENGMYLNHESFRAAYCLTSRDWYHLSARGHALFAPIIADWLSEALYHTGTADQFYDLSSAPEVLRDAVSTLAPAGILSGTGDHLFSPTRAVTRETLSLSLYRLAGSPYASAWTLTDVSPDSETYFAACWVMDAGIFSPTETFLPDQVVTREMLATAMFRYYTEYLGDFPKALVGLGSFPDGGTVAEYARLPMGWALSGDILTPQDGLTKPQSAVSRGQLALSLIALMEQ